MDRRAMLLNSVAASLAAALPRFARSAESNPSLDALFDQFMRETLDLSPITVTGLGLDTGARAYQKRLLDDASETGIARMKALTASQLVRLRAFDAAPLRGADRMNYEVVMYGLRTADAANQRFAYGPGGAGAPYVLSQLTGSYQQIPSFLDTQHTVASKADADAYLARLDDFGTLLDQEIQVARHDLGLGVMPPDFILSRTLDQMQALRAPPPERSPLTESLAAHAREHAIDGDYAVKAADLVRRRVYPALERQIALVEQMQRHAVHEAGVWRLPDGGAYYQSSLVFWATTDQPAREIHALGLQLVQEHTARIDALMRRIGMSTGSVGERLHAMYVDPKYQYPDTDQGKEALLADLNRRVQDMHARLPAWFGVLPKADVIIRRVPANIEAGAPLGYYNNASLDGKRPGIYWINLRDTRERPKWTLPTLTYHESIPGHHLQLSIQQEAGLPLIRKVSFFGAYIEGWAVYAEQLAAEMGVYADDPLGAIGQLHDALMRAVRLVIDTGLHAMHWSRERAVQYFTDMLGDPQNSAAVEVERYCVWPGQACSYMLGKLAFLRQRAKAQAALGARFDIRRFHDAMLLQGAVPLALLDELHAQSAGT